MSKLRGRVIAISGVLIGAMWLVAAAAKIATPFGAYQLTARAAPPGTPPKVLLAAVVAAETLLGASMCLRAVRGFGWSLTGLVAVTAVVLIVRSQVGGLAPCGCFGALFGATLDGALGRLAVLFVLHVSLIVASRRGTATG